MSRPVRRRDTSRETPVAASTLDSPRRAGFQSCSIIPAGREGGQRTTSICPDRIRMHRELRHNAGTIEGVVDAAEDSLRRRMRAGLQRSLSEAAARNGEAIRFAVGRLVLLLSKPLIEQQDRTPAPRQHLSGVHPGLSHFSRGGPPRVEPFPRGVSFKTPPPTHKNPPPRWAPILAAPLKRPPPPRPPGK